MLAYQKEINCCCVDLDSAGSNKIQWMCKTWAKFSVAAQIFFYSLLNAFVFTRHVASIIVWLTAAVLEVNQILLQESEYDFSYSHPSMIFNWHKSHKPLNWIRWQNVPQSYAFCACNIRGLIIWYWKVSRILYFLHNNFYLTLCHNANKFITNTMWQNAMCFHALYFHIFLCELARMDHSCSKVHLYPESFHYEMNQ